jgi:hypothetical protein
MQLALSLWGSTVTYITNCQGVDEPNLTGFVRGVHKAIVFDEADWELIVRCKVLFQASCEGVHLRQSKCQQFSEWKFLYQVPMIICTNSWLQEGEETPHRDWLEANSVHVQIDSHVWCTS